MKKKEPRKLLEIDVNEISLVDRAASRKKFFILKRDGEEIDLEKTFDRLFPEGHPVTENFDELSTDEREILKISLENINEFITDFPAPLLDAVINLVNFGGAKSFEKNSARALAKVLQSAKWPSILLKGASPEDLEDLALEPVEDPEPEPVKKVKKKGLSVDIDPDEISKSQPGNRWPSLTGEI